MAISVDWPSGVISIPQSYLTLISGTLYELDTEQFREDLRALEDDQNGGIAHLKTHNHNTTYTVAGVTYARAILILFPYTVTFEDGSYSVRLAGSNNNIFDPDILNYNSVQVIGQNSAGLQVVSVGSGLSVGEQTQLEEIHKIHGLEDGSPLTVTPSARSAGGISQTITGDGETSTTVTRD